MQHTPPAHQSVDLGGWVLRAGVAAFYIAFGAEKFGSGPHNGWIVTFDRIGFGQWFRAATGVIEVGAGMLYIFPRTCKPAAVLLGATMVGAIVAHLSVLGDPIGVVLPLAALIATIIIALREPEPELQRLIRR